MVQRLGILRQFAAGPLLVGAADLLLADQQRSADRQVTGIEPLVVLQNRFDRDLVAPRDGVECLARSDRMFDEGLFAPLLLLRRQGALPVLLLDERNPKCLVDLQPVGGRRVVFKQGALADIVAAGDGEERVALADGVDVELLAVDVDHGLRTLDGHRRMETCGGDRQGDKQKNSLHLGVICCFCGGTGSR